MFALVLAILPASFLIQELPDVPEFVVPTALIALMPGINFLLGQLFMWLGETWTSEQKKNFVQGLSVLLVGGSAVVGWVEPPVEVPQEQSVFAWTAFLIVWGIYTWRGSNAVHDVIGQIMLTATAKRKLGT